MKKGKDRKDQVGHLGSLIRNSPIRTIDENAYPDETCSPRASDGARARPCHHALCGAGTVWINQRGRCEATTRVMRACKDTVGQSGRSLVGSFRRVTSNEDNHDRTTMDRTTMTYPGFSASTMTFQDS